MKSAQAALIEQIDTTGDFTAEIQTTMHEAIKAFKANNTW